MGYTKDKLEDVDVSLAIFSFLAVQLYAKSFNLYIFKAIWKILTPGP